MDERLISMGNEFYLRVHAVNKLSLYRKHVDTRQFFSNNKPNPRYMNETMRLVGHYVSIDMLLIALKGESVNMEQIQTLTDIAQAIEDINLGDISINTLTDMCRVVKLMTDKTNALTIELAKLKNRLEKNNENIGSM